jgi:hypothetical protein
MYSSNTPSARSAHLLNQKYVPSVTLLLEQIFFGVFIAFDAAAAHAF